MGSLITPEQVRMAQSAAELHAMQQAAVVPAAPPSSYVPTVFNGMQYNVIQAEGGARVLAVRRKDGRPLPGGADAYEFPMDAAPAESIARALLPTPEGSA